MSTNC